MLVAALEKCCFPCGNGLFSLRESGHWSYRSGVSAKRMGWLDVSCEHLKSAYQRANISTEVGRDKQPYTYDARYASGTTAQGAHGRHCIDDFARVRTLAP